jgi:hypothetical protein
MLTRELAPRLLSRDLAAAYCGVSPNHFEEYIAAEVPAVRIGRRSLWDRRAIDRWLDQQSGFMGALPPVDEWLGALGK